MYHVIKADVIDYAYKFNSFNHFKFEISIKYAKKLMLLS